MAPLPTLRHWFIMSQVYLVLTSGYFSVLVLECGVKFVQNKHYVDFGDLARVHPFTPTRYTTGETRRKSQPTHPGVLGTSPVLHYQPDDIIGPRIIILVPPLFSLNQRCKPLVLTSLHHRTLLCLAV